jgi:hypothetical protein
MIELQKSNNNIFDGVDNNDNYHQKKLSVENELRKINDEINRITGKITLSKYRIQKYITDYHQALNKRSELDKLLTFRLATSFSHPRMDIEGYTNELYKIQKKYNRFRDKYLKDIPLVNTDDLNIYFPDNNRWKIDHLTQIRKEASQTVHKSHYDFQQQETILFQQYQNKKHKLEWTMTQISNDKKTSHNQKKHRLKIVRDEITKLEDDMMQHFSSLANSFPELVKQTQLINNLSCHQLKKVPIKLETNSEDDPRQRLIKRRLIMLNMRKNQCETRIQQLTDEVKTTITDINTISDTDLLYENANNIMEFNFSVGKQKKEIKQIRDEVKELEKYMQGLIKSRDILSEEIYLLDSMESLTNNDIIYELLKSKPSLDMKNKKVKSIYDSHTPEDCIVEDNMVDLSSLGDNIDLENLDLDVITQVIDTELDESQLSQYGTLDPQTKYKMDKIYNHELDMPIDRPNVYMDIEKNINSNDLSMSTKMELNLLASKLSKLDNMSFPGITSDLNLITQDNNDNNNDNNNDIYDMNIDANDMKLLKEFEKFEENIKLNNTLQDNTSQNYNEVNNHLNELIKIDES